MKRIVEEAWALILSRRGKWGEYGESEGLQLAKRFTALDYY